MASALGLVEDEAGAHVELDGRRIDYTELAVSRGALAAVAVWLSLADGQHTRDEILLAVVRAADAVGRELGSPVQVSMPYGRDRRRLDLTVSR